MDYRILAENLMDLQAQLHHIPLGQTLSALEGGSFFLLNYLNQHASTAHPKELSRGMAVSSARIAALLNHLEGRGLIRRAPDPDDSRQIIVSLTEEGRRHICKKREETLTIVADTLEELGPEDAQAFLRIQEKLLRNFQRHAQETVQSKTVEREEMHAPP